ncbi:uncharacterized protein EAE98_004158 [Botrytis deweyae]|uniref:HNH nuclease domain-containing protein n=1 Tax=Botrytis deweyae TaxID=2478750 RepID=A0ABQ7ITL8_9HELO|nr:uncharacterized protein EAE98_004158 [Botrytis deweyae]KAF7932859.1 hypothetical protein EAE98_004158 [Botrytis deweyae]
MSTRNGPALQIHEIGVGCILWLPPFNDTNGDLRPLCQRHTGMRHLMDINAFDHPAVVLNIHNRYGPDPSIHFITVSLSSKKTLRTTNEDSLVKFVLSLSRFDAYNWGQTRPSDYRLTHRSYLYLMERLGLHADTFHPISRINNGLLQAPSPAPPPPTQQLQTVNRHRENNPYAYLEPDECCP